LATGNVARLDYREKARELFDRYLDLGPLHGRARGLVRCAFHPDKGPSLSVDLDRGVFCCFGCGEQGGAKRFAELVGEVGRQPAEQPARLESEGTRAWRQIAVRGRTEYQGRGAWLPWLFANGTVRVMTQAVDAARRIATALGPDHERVWEVLERAGRVEREALAAETQLDELLEGGRLLLDADDRLPRAGRRA
jgi:CHC2-type zinc finger protein